MLLIRNLAKSQGLYGRLLEEIEELDVADLENLIHFLEEKNFKDEVDFVLFYEGGE
jgi:hypothetical protein